MANVEWRAAGPAYFVRGETQNRVNYLNGGTALTVGQILWVGGRVHIVTSPEGIDAGALGSMATAGEFRLPKSTGVAFAQGDMVAYNFGVGTNAVVAAAAGLPQIGWVTEAAASGDTTCVVRINEYQNPVGTTTTPAPTTTAAP